MRSWCLGLLVQHLWGWDPLQAIPQVRPSPGTQTQKVMLPLPPLPQAKAVKSGPERQALVQAHAVSLEQALSPGSCLGTEAGGACLHLLATVGARGGCRKGAHAQS